MVGLCMGRVGSEMGRLGVCYENCPGLYIGRLVV